MDRTIGEPDLELPVSVIVANTLDVEADNPEALTGFHEIEIIRAIVRHSGFHAGSDATGLAQSAISKRVRHLESRMQVVLLERYGRGARLPAEGRSAGLPLDF